MTVEITEWSREEHRAFDLIANGSVWRERGLDYRRGPDGLIEVPASRILAAGLAYLKPNARLGLTRRGRQYRDQRQAGQPQQTTPEGS